MEPLNSAHAEKIVEVCRQNAAEVAASFGRSLGIEGNLTATVGSSDSSSSLELAPLLAGPGLLIVLPVKEGGALVALSERTKLVPAWCAQPDATGESKLANWTIYIDADNDGKLDTNEKRAVTDSAGAWKFSSLSAGTYNIRIVAKSGYTRTTPTGSGAIKVVAICLAASPTHMR